MKALFAAALLIASPVSAAECYYAGDLGGKITFLENGENEVLYSRDGKAAETCTWARTDEGSGTDIACPDGVKDFIVYAGPKTDIRAVMVFDAQAFRRVCG